MTVMGKIFLASLLSEVAAAAFPALRPLAPLSRTVSGILLAEELLRRQAR